jgi:ATP-dependent protease ClpP protease subunit
MSIINKGIVIIAALFTITAFAGKKSTTNEKSLLTSKNNNVIVLTSDNTLSIHTYYSGEAVSNIVQKARLKDSKLPSNEPFYLVINSGGGLIDAGIELIENLNNLNRPVHTLSLWAASMAFQTVQGINGKRFITSNGTLMSHKARGTFSGEFPGQLDSRYSYYLKKVQRLEERAASRTNGKLTLAEYRNLIENEYFCDGNDCIAQGFADEIVAPRCDNSLNGTHEESYDRFMYMGSLVEIVDIFSDCPLQTEALSTQVFIDGKPLFNQRENKGTTEKNVNNFLLNNLQQNTIFNSMSAETIENIRKIINEKLELRKNSYREVRKY